jgi:hypothetical protein
VYVIGVRESTNPQSWSLLLMEFDDVLGFLQAVPG